MILNCVKKAYQEMVKEGLTPLEFNFPSFSINHENFNSAGLSILEDKIRLGIDSDKYQI